MGRKAVRCVGDGRHCDEDSGVGRKAVRCAGDGRHCDEHSGEGDDFRETNS